MSLVFWYFFNGDVASWIVGQYALSMLNSARSAWALILRIISLIAKGILEVGSIDADTLTVGIHLLLIHPNISGSF